MSGATLVSIHFIIFLRKGFRVFFLAFSEHMRPLSGYKVLTEK